MAGAQAAFSADRPVAGFNMIARAPHDPAAAHPPEIAVGTEDVRQAHKILAVSKSCVS